MEWMKSLFAQNVLLIYTNNLTPYWVTCLIRWRKLNQKPLRSFVFSRSSEAQVGRLSAGAPTEVFLGPCWMFQTHGRAITLWLTQLSLPVGMWMCFLTWRHAQLSRPPPFDSLIAQHTHTHAQTHTDSDPATTCWAFCLLIINISSSGIMMSLPPDESTGCNLKCAKVKYWYWRHQMLMQQTLVYVYQFYTSGSHSARIFV